MTDVNNPGAEPSPQLSETTIDLHAFSPEQRQEWRETGKLPEKAKPAEASDPSKATDPPKEVDSEGKPKSAADPEPADKQEGKGKHQPKPDAEKRISELTAKIRDYEERERKREADAKPPSKAEAKPEPPKFTRPKPARSDVDEKGQPKYATEDDFTEAIADWKADQKIADYRRQEAEHAQQQALKELVSDVQKRYPDAGKVLQSAVDALSKPGALNPVVYGLIDNSPVAMDLMYALASDEAEFAKFLSDAKDNPNQAIRRAVIVEKLVMEELGKKGADAKESDDKGTPERGADGKFKASPETPEKKDPPAPPEKTAKPLTEVGGRGTPADDSVAAAVKANDFRAVKRELERRALASVK